MNTNAYISRATCKKIALSLLLGVFALVSSATLGEGKLNRDKPRKSLLSSPSNIKPGAFSLRSGYTFRGNQVITRTENYINLNTVITFQQGRTSYVMPLKKKISLNLSTQNQVRSATVKINL